MTPPVLRTYQGRLPRPHTWQAACLALVACGALTVVLLGAMAWAASGEGSLWR